MLVNKLKALLFISASIIASTNAFSMKLDLDETPIGTYTKRPLPFLETLPEQVTLRMTPVKDQGPLGTCVSFAASACAEFFYRSLGIRFSEGEFTVLAETHLPPKFGGTCTPGLNLGEALKLGQKYGFVKEDRLPYSTFLTYVANRNNIKSMLEWENKTPIMCTRGNNPTLSYNTTMNDMNCSLRLSETVYDIGYRFLNHYPIHYVPRNSLIQSMYGNQSTPQIGCIGIACKADVEYTKNALAQGYPVAAALPVFGSKMGNKTVRNWDNDQLIRSNGNFPLIGSPTLTKHWIEGYHAVVLTGFDNKKGTFRVRNSWGTTWGDQGEADISYAHIRRYATELVAVGI